MANSAFSKKRWITSEKTLYMQDDLDGGDKDEGTENIDCGGAAPASDYSSYDRDKIYDGGNA